MNRILAIVVFCVIVAVHVLTCFQSIDLADEGHWLGNAHFILSDPESVMYSFSYWLSVLVPAVWNNIFGETVMGQRFLTVIVKALICVSSYQILKKFLPPDNLLMGIVWGALLMYGGTMFLYGSSFTALFYAVAIALMLKGMFDSRTKGMLFCLLSCGFVLGVAVFARIPNIVDAVFLSVPIWWFFVNRRISVANCYVMVGTVCIGFLIGGASMILVLVGLGQWGCFCDMLSLFKEIGQSGHHSKSILIAVQLRYWMFVCVVSVAWAVYFAVTAVVARRDVRLCNLFSLFVLAAMFFIDQRYRGYEFYRVLPISLFVLGTVLTLFYNTNSKFRVVVFAAFVCLCVLPLGSDVPACVNKYCMPLILPLACYATSDRGEIISVLRRYGKVADSDFAQILRSCRIVLVGLILLPFWHVWTDPIRDFPDRRKLTAASGIPVYEHIATTAERALALKELCVHIQKEMGDCKLLLSFPCLPGIYAYVDKTPYIGGTWTRLFSDVQFRRQVERSKERFHGELPFVLEEKWNSSWPTWPINRVKYVKPGSATAQLVSEIKRFLLQHSYVVCWENEDFILYKPPQTR